VDVRAKPFAQRREIAASDLLVEVGDVFDHLLPDLHGHHRAQQVRREIADEPDRPVSVLQHALRVVGDVDAEVVVHPRVPDLRQVLQLDAVVDDVALELEAKDHVHAVRHLVGLDADERRLHAVDAGEEAVEVDGRELLGERLLHPRIEEAPERHAAADEVLPEPALRLVDAERARAADRQARDLRR
jgi:hypothetical protein